MSKPHERDVPLLRHGGFWVTGPLVTTPAGTVQRGQMWVEWLAGEHVRRPHPLVLVHGGGGQGTDWLITADGRPGWAVDFAQAGFAVYVVDRPGHGRSPGHPAVLGALGPPMPVEAVAGIFAPPDAGGDQTGWPWGRDADSPELLALAASAGSLRADFAAAQEVEADQLVALLGQVGPAVLVTHSAGAPGVWLASSRARQSVVGIVAVEPMGPPYLDVPGLGALNHGLTSQPLGGDLAGLPVLVLEADASPMTGAADSVVAFLVEQGAVAARGTFTGVSGAGHGVMMEMHSSQAARTVVDWVSTLP